VEIQFCETEISKLELIVRKKNEILGLDVAVDDLIFVGMRQGRQRLTGKVECASHRDTALDPVRQRLVAEFHCDNELFVDVAGIHDRQNIRMPELRGHLHFVQKLLMPCVVIGPWYLQRDLYFLNRILCPIHVRQRPRRNASENPVFAQSLASL